MMQGSPESGTVEILPLCRSAIRSSSMFFSPTCWPGSAQLNASNLPSGDQVGPPHGSAIFRSGPPSMLTTKTSLLLLPKATLVPSGEDEGIETHHRDISELKAIRPRMFSYG